MKGTKEEIWSDADEAEFQRIRPLINKRIRQVKGKHEFDIQFAADILRGEAGERTVVEALQKGEVKRMYGVNKYKRVFIEFENYHRPSGLMATEAEWFIIVFDGKGYEGEVMVGVKTERLKRICDLIEFSPKCGDNKASLGKSIPIGLLMASSEDIL